MRIVKSENGYLWYVVDEQDEIVQVRWSKKECVQWIKFVSRSL